jgi:hypothetical protein
MAKKLTLLIAAVAVLAFMVPAMASAAAPLTESGGTVVVPVGSAIIATSTNVRINTSLGTLSCKKVVFKNNVSANEVTGGKTRAEATSLETFTAQECEVEGIKAPVEKLRVPNLQTGTALGLPTGNGTATISFTALLPGPLDCLYTGTNVPFHYLTTTLTNSIKFFSVALTGSPTACGSATFSGEFALTTREDGKAVEIA